MILTVANTKGGVGKTTLAFLIAVARSRAGRDVWLVDADYPQLSANTAAGVRSEANREPILACSVLTNSRSVMSQVKRQAAKYDDVIIDCGGLDTESLRASLMVADTALIPVVPRGLDVWALGSMTALIDGARAARSKALRAFVVINEADPGSSADNTDAASAIRDFPSVKLIEPMIVRRKAFATAAAHGMGIDEVPTPDLKACNELSAVLTALF